MSNYSIYENVTYLTFFRTHMTAVRSRMTKAFTAMFTFERLLPGVDTFVLLKKMMDTF